MTNEKYPWLPVSPIWRDPPVRVVAVIPARGGSKSVVGKNIRELHGKPLIVWSIETAQQCRSIQDVYVTSDDGVIQGIAADAGARIIRQPHCIAEDWSVDYQWCLYFLTEVGPENASIIVHLRPTHPDRDPAEVDAAVETFLMCHQADSLRSVSVALQTPYKMWTLQNPLRPPTNEPGGNWLVPVMPREEIGIAEPYNTQRQRLPVVYWQNGYVDITRARTVLDLCSMTGRRIMPWLIDEESMDVDYESDWKRMEKAFVRGRDGANPYPS